MHLRISVSPHGRLLCDEYPPDGDAPPGSADLSDETSQALLEAFQESSAEGLLLLAGQSIRETLPADFVFWRNWARQFLQAASRLDEEQQATFIKDSSRTTGEVLVRPPNPLELAALVSAAPPMRGLEYLTPDVLVDLWFELAHLTALRASEADGGLPGFLKDLNPFRQSLGRVTFRLAENKRDEARPFAFIATYTHKLSARASVQHLPLAQALKQYAGERDQAKLGELLAPVRAAADRSPLVKEWLTSRALFQPQALTISQAYQFLREVPVLEDSGLVVSVPNWWQSRKPPRPGIRVRLGNKKPAAVGGDALLDFSVDLALDGEVLTDEERRRLLSGSDGLMLLRGKWVEVDREKLQDALSQWEALQDERAAGIGFLEGMRMLAGAKLDQSEEDVDDVAGWTTVAAGDWLKDSLAKLRDPSGVLDCHPGEGLHATLRPYQADGVRWLWFMTSLRLGGCLADDMGLGKTIQVIDLLLRLRRETPSLESREPGGEPADENLANSRPSLLIVPASLLGNWKQELARFAPQLRVEMVHRSETDDERLEQLARDPAEELAGVDLVVTTYTLVRKAEWLGRLGWRLVILDEAQAIKNAGSAQTKAVKKVAGGSVRIALTGTPVENQLGDLWSVFDFCCPGLLGTSRQFKSFVRRLNEKDDVEAYGSLRRLIQPYVLRRMKTDPAIAPDLPEKTEMRVECGLTKKQAALYQAAVIELQEELDKAKEGPGIQRKGIVLATMMKLKQICNHPSQYLNQAEFPAEASAKFGRLAALCEPILERQEKVLVFTQFQSLCEPLARHLAVVFGRPGLVLHGGVAVGKRKELVKTFQEDDTVPFFVISVKAGGTGLTLTAASHVVHFDRWWNPAVENQATDRAFRIGQKRNVLVHKFVCRGTLEERIDEMLREKQELADRILGATAEGETLLTEMSDQELLNFVALDITRASAED